jgi:hypothetical protein
MVTVIELEPPPIGIWDWIEIYSGPSVISPVIGDPSSGCPMTFCPIVYDVQFHDVEEPSTVVSWIWNIRLFHSTGDYSLNSLFYESSGTTNLTLAIYSPFTIPNMDWIRDLNGNVLCRIDINCMDSDGYGHTASKIIGIIYPPNKPQITIEQPSCTSVKLSYISDGATSYKIYYGTNSGGPYNGTGLDQGNSPINAGSSTSYTLTGLTSGEIYYFVVAGINSEGESVYSNESIFPVIYDIGEYTATTSAIWEPGSNPFNNVSEVNIANKLIIPTDVSMTVKNMTLKFGPNAKLIVKRGGKLVLDNAIFTSTEDICNPSIMWQGIELWGNKDESQYISGAQGKVVLENGAVIENALNAIRTIKSLGDIDGDGNEDYDWAYTGGIVQANNAIFRNNKNGIWLGSYHNSHPFTEAPMSNVGYIKNCTFETTSEYIDISNPPYEFIGLYDVDGISIYGNTFRNTNTDYTGNGIMSYDASYNVKPLCISPIYPCTEYQPNTFENLYYGIYAAHSNNFIPVTINGNIFNNNFGSITLKGVNNATITKNNFDIFNNFFV